MVYGRPLRAPPWGGGRPPRPTRPPTTPVAGIERLVPQVAALLTGQAPRAGISHGARPPQVAALLLGLAPFPNITRSAQPARIAAVLAGLLPTTQIGYTTLFPLAENPINEGGLWANGLSVGGNWNNIRTNVGLAYGAVTSSGNADCMALLSSYIADHSIEATVFLQVGYAPSTTHDIELMVRGQLTAGNARGYVLRTTWNNAYTQLVRWNGPLADKTILTTTVLNGGITRALVTGDVLRLRVAGSVLTGSWNGVDVITATDSTWATGAPGMAFLINPGGTVASFGFSRIYAQGASASKTVAPTRGQLAFTGRAPTIAVTTIVTGLGWKDNIFPMSINRGSYFDLAPHIDGDQGDIVDIVPKVAGVEVTLPSGVAITDTPTWRVTASAAATLGNTNNLNFTIEETAAPPPSPGGGNWATRIAGTGVVWYHNFDTAAEVNQFRWSGGYMSGNDPLAKAPDGPRCQWVATGGPDDNGGFLRLTYPLGANTGSTYWYRPYNALTGATNGRGVDDPAANGTIALRSFNVSDGSSTLYSWGNDGQNPGWYGHATHVASNPTKFQGNDFYLQVRVRRSSMPGPPPNSASYTNITGKFVWLSITPATAVTQEFVTYGQSASEDVVGQQPRHRVYNGTNFTPFGQGLPNETTVINNADGVNDWRYTGGWDTLLYHVTPGTNGGTGTNRTRFEAWAQRDLTLFPAESGQYTKIWDEYFTQSFDLSPNSAGSPCFEGWNALLLAIYHNGSQFTTSGFNFDYDQVIFSKQTIAAPTA